MPGAWMSEVKVCPPALHARGRHLPVFPAPSAPAGSRRPWAADAFLPSPSPVHLYLDVPLSAPWVRAQPPSATSAKILCTDALTVTGSGWLGLGRIFRRHSSASYRE